MGCNVNPYTGVCGFLVKAFKWLPVVLISAIVVWSYYAYVVHLCILTVSEPVVRYLLLVLYHILFILFLWAYWRTVWTNPGPVPSRFKLTTEELDNLESTESDVEQRRILEQVVIDKDLPVAMRTIQGAVRYCDRCSIIKPDRAHHCSVCGTCVLKMDHHCPWVNTCVAFLNYKFFVLFLFYGFIYCIFIAFSVLKYFLQFWARSFETTGQSKFHILFLFFVSSMFSISLCSLLCYHIHLVLNNRTTLEAFRSPVFRRGPDKQGFSLGKLGNLQEVFGDNWKTLLLPMFTSMGDGLTYPQRFQDPEMGRRDSEERWSGEEERAPMLRREEEREERIRLSESESEEEELLSMQTVLTSPGAQQHTGLII
jgi:hypothetical protein